ncbi:helix-turn-helix domain-containing protein [Streptomyces blattellae]|uniref:helix-turn-helix domain-containing protein n=1 Tax=Streptomyces blattellae TaxID=2569855 RepID=UPI001E572863|nr:helix-turn-helix domain-containing protein [Streptomyces blattellae]
MAADGLELDDGGEPMIGMEFRSEDVPAELRFERWRELIGRTHAPSEMSGGHTTDFRASMVLLDLGAVRAWTATFRAVGYRRTPRLIRQSDPELCHVTVLRQGSVAVDQAGHQAMCTEHDLFVIDTSQPYHCQALDGPQPVNGVSLEVPKALLDMRTQGLERLAGRRIAGREGTGALLTQFLNRLIADRHILHPADGPRLGTVAVDLLSAVLAHELNAEEVLAPETRQRTLILRIQAFIQRHLAEPELSPRTIAEAHHISLSYLHRLFRATGTTVSCWIRGQRLERARGDLADPALRHVPACHIGARVGFAYPEVFHRAFRSAYGLTPGDYRHEVFTSPPFRAPEPE